MKRALGRAAALSLGVVWGFFVAFNVVFSDVFGLRAMLGAVAFVFVAYALLGFGFGVAGSATGWRWVWWLAAPGVALVALGVFDNTARALYHAAVVVAVLAGSSAGAGFGAWLARRIGRSREG